MNGLPGKAVYDAGKLKEALFSNLFVIFRKMENDVPQENLATIERFK
jgi:hypothetical protein